MTATTFSHPGLLYRGPAEYLAGVTAFVRSALDSGDAVLVAVPGRNLERLRRALAEVAAGIAFDDMAVTGRNPGWIIPGVLLSFAAEHPGRRVSIVGEPVWPGRTAAEYPACAIHEALINEVFAGRDAAILCPYDAAGLDATTIADAWRTHPQIIAGGVAGASDRYTDPVATAAAFDRALPPPPPGARTMAFHRVTELSAVRAFVRAAGAVLPGDRVEDLLLAANELVTNSIRYCGGGRITLWPEPAALVCQVDDAGRLADPLAGRVPPDRESASGRGLILVNRVCDLVRVHRHRSGTTIRVHLSTVG